jgi:Holliday junction resolvasome RuvABC endonuclease subunit
MRIKMMRIGIDPGGSGSMSIISTANNGDESMDIIRFKKLTEHDLHSIVKETLSVDCPKFCVIEKVHAMPMNGSIANFKLGYSFGMLKSLLIENKIPFEEKIPSVWMKYFGMKKGKNKSSTEWKNELKGRAQQFYPKHKVTLDMADSMLVARYCQLNY